MATQFTSGRESVCRDDAPNAHGGEGQRMAHEREEVWICPEEKREEVVIQ